MQEVRAEDLDAHMQAMFEWAEEVNAKAKLNIEKAQKSRRNNLMQNSSRLLFNQETNYGFRIHEKTLNRGQVRVELEWTMQDCGADQQRNIPPTQ